MLRRYDRFLPLHELWLEYIHDVVADTSESDLALKLLKADFHGAIIKVASSLCSPMIGLEGILLQETQNTFRVVTQHNQFKSTSFHSV
jgi:ribonuclease P protein subunit POP4